MRRKLALAFGDELRHRAVKDRMQDLVLALEIKIDGAVGDAGLGGDVRDLGVEITLCRQTP